MLIKSNSIAFKRKMKGKTQTELARAVGCSRAKISAIELNEKSPDLLLARKIAAFLGVTINDVFEFDE